MLLVRDPDIHSLHAANVLLDVIFNPPGVCLLTILSNQSTPLVYKSSIKWLWLNFLRLAPSLNALRLEPLMPFQGPSLTSLQGSWNAHRL